MRFSYRVCQVTDSREPGGAERVLCLLSEEYAARGISQEIVLLNRGWTLDELTKRGLAPTVMETGRAMDLGWIRAFARFLRDCRVDVVHGHLLDGSFYAACSARLAGIPCIVTEHGDAAVGAKRGWRYT